MDAIRPTRASLIELRKGITTGDAFQQIYKDCLRHAGSNAALITDEEPDAVHQTRVALRRSRSLLTLFKPYLTSQPRKSLYKDLRESGRLLAASRDWDVFRFETLPRIAKRFPEIKADGGFGRLECAAEAKRMAAYRSLQGVQIVPSMQIGIITHDRIETTAPELLDAQYFLVRQAFRHIDTPDKRHALRKAMKKLRYGVEFLGALYEGKAVRAFLDHCKDTQEVLGKMNDAMTMIRLLTELQQDAEIDATQSVFAIPMEWAKHHQDKAEAQVVAAYADFKAAKPFWD